MEIGNAYDGAEWLRGNGPSSDVVLSSRVRLARNFAGCTFNSRATQTNKRNVLELAERSIVRAEVTDHLSWIDLSMVSDADRRVLVERHLISKQLAKAEGPRALAVSRPDERLAIMVNEEDHLRIQVLRSGLALSDAYTEIDRIDDRIEEHADLAYSPRFGYLTACPTNVGTGIRVSVMLHLPGLKISGDLDKVHRAAKAMSLAVRGFYGEGSDAVGDFFQISNQTTLGKSETEIVQGFEHEIIPKLCEFERLSRRTLLDKRPAFIEDKVYRALGTLQSARLLKADEALQLLSFVRLGVTSKMITDVSIETVNRLTLLTQPAHLERVVGNDLNQAERRVERATLVRRAFEGGPLGR